MSMQHAPYHKWWIWIVYLILLIAGVPWYWKAGDTTIVFGMRAWVLTAIIVSISVSCFTSFLWLTLWQSDEARKEDHHE